MEQLLPTDLLRTDIFLSSAKKDMPAFLLLLNHVTHCDIVKQGKTGPSLRTDLSCSIVHDLRNTISSEVSPCSCDHCIDARNFLSDWFISGFNFQNEIPMRTNASGRMIITPVRNESKSHLPISIPKIPINPNDPARIRPQTAPRLTALLLSFAVMCEQISFTWSD